MIKTYNKLVRDKIPEIIEANGDICETKILSDDEYAYLLDMKLSEEAAEYLSDKNIEELADIMEVVYAIAKSKGFTIDELEKARAEKVQKRGGFEKKIMLVKVYEKEEV